MTYLEKYLKENRCSEKDFWEAQIDYDWFCPDDIGVDAGCPGSYMTCEKCWKREITI